MKLFETLNENIHRFVRNGDNVEVAMRRNVTHSDLAVNLGISIIDKEAVKMNPVIDMGWVTKSIGTPSVEVFGKSTTFEVPNMENPEVEKVRQKTVDVFRRTYPNDEFVKGPFDY